MVGNVLDDFEHQIGTVTLVPSGGGAFELTVGDELVYSKKATKRHADYEVDVKERLTQLLG